MAGLRIIRQTVQPMGPLFVANIWTEDGQHFTGRGPSHASAHLRVSIAFHAAEARAKASCDVCQAPQDGHQTWCPKGPGAMYQ